MRRYNYRLSYDELETVIEVLKVRLRSQRHQDRRREYARLVADLERQRDNWKEFEKERATNHHAGKARNVGI